MKTWLVRMVGPNPQEAPTVEPNDWNIHSSNYSFEGIVKMCQVRVAAEVAGVVHKSTLVVRLVAMNDWIVHWINYSFEGSVKTCLVRTVAVVMEQKRVPMVPKNGW